MPCTSVNGAKLYIINIKDFLACNTLQSHFYNEDGVSIFTQIFVSKRPALHGTQKSINLN
jgi:hypothetical protein